jgi:hydroxylamine reductase
MPPAFITPGVLKILQQAFDLKLITTPQEDLKAILKLS